MSPKQYLTNTRNPAHDTGRIITEAIISVARDAQPAPHGGPDKLLLDLPLPLTDAVLRHLRLFKLRAKVRQSN
jgi:hypothetical protein